MRFRQLRVEQLEPRQLLATLSWEPLYDPGVGGHISSVSISPHDSDRVLIGGDMLGIGLSTDGGSNWSPTFGLDANDAASAYTIEQFAWHPTDPNVVWVGTASGPFESVDGGQNWTRKRSGFPSYQSLQFISPVQTILFDPSDTSHETLLAFTGNFRRFNSSNHTGLGQVWRSTNGGDNWTLLTTLPGSPYIEQAVYKTGSDNTIYLAASNGFYISNNDGVSWTNVDEAAVGLPTTNLQWLTVSPSDGDTLWVSTDDQGVWKSEDGGATFVDKSSGLPTGAGTAGMLEVDRNSADGRDFLFWAFFDDGGNGNAGRGLYRSTNGGNSWSELSNYGSGPYPNVDSIRAMGVDPNNADRAFFTTQSMVYRTTDTGFSLQQVSSVSTGGGTWRGTGYSGQVSQEFKFNPFHTQQSGMAALDAGKWRSVDDLQTWKRGGSGLDTWDGASDVAFTSDINTWYLAQGQFGNNYKLYKTTDGGSSWSTKTLPGGTSGEIRSIYAHPTDTNRIWLARSNNLYYSTDSGGSWNEVATNVGSIQHITADEINAPDLVYVAGSNGVFVGSTSTTFTEIGNFPRNGVTRLQIDPVKSDRIYAINANDSSSSQRGLYRYDGDTGSWITIGKQSQTGFPSLVIDVAVDPTDNTRIVLATDQDPFQSNTGETGIWMREGLGLWTRQNDGLPNLRVSVIEFKPGSSTLVAGTNGSGYFVTDTVEVVEETFLAVEDGSTRRGKPTTNYGNSGELVLKGDTNGTLSSDRVSYLKFDLSSYTASVDTATLRLFGRGWSSGSTAFDVHAVSNVSWLESSLNWSNRPTIGAIQSSGVVTDTLLAWYEIDLSGYVQSEMTAGRDTISLALVSSNSADNGLGFQSSESLSGNAPELLVSGTSALAASSASGLAIQDASNNAAAPIQPSSNSPEWINNLVFLSLGSGESSGLLNDDVAGQRLEMQDTGQSRQELAQSAPAFYSSEFDTSLAARDRSDSGTTSAQQPSERDSDEEVGDELVGLDIAFEQI